MTALSTQPRDYTPAPVPHAARRVLLFVAGHTGRVGSTLARLLVSERERLRAEARIELHLACGINRRQVSWHDPDAPWRSESQTRTADDWPALLRRFRAYPGPKLFVDCTAAPEVAQRYPEFFRQGIGVITANKLGNSGSGADYRTLLELARTERVSYRYETTVGAALPVLATLADLRDSGDRIRRIEAVLSGTLSFLFQRLNQGTPFSAAVREARDQGYTEPHPVDDLKAADSARKLLILLREAGIAWEPERVTVRGLVPPELAQERDPERFLKGLEHHDEEWALRVAAADRQGLKLACLAEFDGKSARVGLTQVPAADPFAQLGAGENLVRVWTQRYQPVPLSIAGPGAGSEVTAAGLLTDLIKAATLTQRM